MKHLYPVNVRLNTIANWQLAPNSCSTLQVSLPKIQRGFVWEPSKVINLWDSLLRGFPIGSFMLSEVAEDGSTLSESKIQNYWLLDGQQRATSIAMGFYNPWSKNMINHQIWSLKQLPTLWLDMLPQVEDETKLYFPLLVTKSHPWGYKHNGDVLSWGERSKALTTYMAELQSDQYTSYPVEKCFPHLAGGLPIPMTMLIEAHQPSDNSDQDFRIKLSSLCNSLPEGWRERYAERFASITDEFWKRLRNALRQIESCRVHLNYLSQESAANDRFTNDDNSVLFVRLNAGGTPLDGEELIFSMFKSLFPKAKDAVEESAADFMVPSKLFTLFVRLVLAEQDPRLLWKPVGLRDFKNYLRQEEEGQAFKHSLGEFINDGVADLMRKARELLLNDSSFGLSGPVATRTINQAPDVFLALLYWLRKGGVVELGGEDHRKLIGCFTAISWFGPSNASDRRDALKSWVESVGTNVAACLWSPVSIQRLFIHEESFLPYLPPPEDLSDFLIGTVMGMDSEYYHYDQISNHLLESDHALAKHYGDYFTNCTPENIAEQTLNHFRTFLGRLWPCRNILMFAQRRFIRESFRDFGQWEYALKDSNCPWDWDHIYPSAYGLRRVNPKYRCWHNSIGNLRAEKLSDNRRNQADAPIIKLERAASRADSFVPEAIWDLMKSAGDARIKDDSEGDQLCKIILKRMVAIYREWYDALRIGSLTESPSEPASS